MNIRPIRNEADYDEALQMLEMLIGDDPTPDSEDGEKLSILSSLVEKYEESRYPQSLPSPIEAIQFRMEQADLKPVDLVPYLGSRSKVSEILSGKRSLSLEMIRALEAGLGIPAQVLIQEPEMGIGLFDSWSESLVREMDKRGYFAGPRFNGKNKSDLLSAFFGDRQISHSLLTWRKSKVRTSVRTDPRALAAWSEHLRHKASSVEIKVKYEDGVVDKAFLERVIRFSSAKSGPLLARDYLRDHGIVLVVANHLPKTRVDGVAVLTDEERPIIGLSLRFDRLDNFWFTLLHELAHVSLHLKHNDVYFDELENGIGVDVSELEKEADDLAQEAIIPASKWESSPAKMTPSALAAESLAAELDIHVAVVAGYIRHKSENYFYLKKIVNGDSSRVRYLFESQLDG
jgi:HTH-type transcriptional regulator/antitoxin HigA